MLCSIGDTKMTAATDSPVKFPLLVHPFEKSPSPVEDFIKNDHMEHIDFKQNDPFSESTGNSQIQPTGSKVRLHKRYRPGLQVSPGLDGIKFYPEK